MSEENITLGRKLDRLIDAMFGFEGNDGLVSNVSNVKDRVTEIENKLPTFWTREQHEKMHSDYLAELAEKQKANAEHGERRQLSRRDKLMLFFVGTGTLISMVAGILEWIGRSAK